MAPTMSDSAIAIRSVRKTRGGFALRTADVDVPTGFVTGLVGPNGASRRSSG